MSDFEHHLRDLVRLCEAYSGTPQQPPLPAGVQRQQVAGQILASPVLASLNTPYAQQMLPRINDTTQSIDERVRLADKLVTQTLYEVSMNTNYADNLAKGMTPEEIAQLADEIERGEF